jgi:hypothetical protein
MEQLREAKRIYDQLSGERPGNLKSRVLQSLSSTKEGHNRRISSKQWVSIASATLVAFILAGVFVTHKGADATMASALELGKTLSKQPTTPEQRKVWGLMYHAIDHYSTVQGVILSHLLPDEHLRVEFGEEVRPTPQGYGFIVNTDIGKLDTEEIVKGGYSLNIHPKEHIATRLPWVVSPDHYRKICRFRTTSTKLIRWDSVSFKISRIHSSFYTYSKITSRIGGLMVRQRFLAEPFIISVGGFLPSNLKERNPSLS